MNDFELKREKWLKEVATTCNKYGEILDKDYYVFQTDSKKYSPEILLIGINPGGSENFKIRNWDELDSDPVTLYEKPDWEKKCKLKGADVMRARLKKVFYNDILFEKLKKTTMINLLYFNTKDSNQAYTLKNEIREFCKQKTLEFIKLVNPKNIIFLTSDKNELKSIGIKDILPIGDNVWSGVLNDKTILIVPHYAARAPLNYSTENGRKIGDKLLQSLL